MSSPVEELTLVNYCQGVGANICCGDRQIGGSIGVDANPDAKAALIHADARLLPFTDNSLDYIVSAHGLEHIQDGPLLVIREWVRCLKVGGRIAIVVPDGSAKPLQVLQYNAKKGKMNPNGHCHIFTPAILFALLVQSGLEASSTRTLDRSDYWDTDVVLGTGIKSSSYQKEPCKWSKLVWLNRTIKSANIKGQLMYRIAGFQGGEG